MVQTLDFVRFANNNPSERERIIHCISSETPCKITMDRFILSFDLESKSTIVDKISEDVPFAVKIVKCRIPYSVLIRILNNDWDDLTGLEWL